MKPTVGRIVHYKVAESDSPAIKNNNVNPGDVLPALVVRTWSDDMANLMVFPDGVMPVWKTSVHVGNENGEWSWPPMQPVPNIPPQPTEPPK